MYTHVAWSTHPDWRHLNRPKFRHTLVMPFHVPQAFFNEFFRRWPPLPVYHTVRLRWP